MKAIHNYSGDATWGVIPYIQKIFDSLSEEDSDIVFFNGFSFMDHAALREPYKDYRRKCLLAHWSPCEFMTRKDYHYFDSYEFFTDVYTVCPFTCKFMNEYFGNEKFKYIPYPYTNYSVDKFYEYDSLCSWFGSIHGQDHISAVALLSKYNYKFITSQKNTWMHHPYEYNKCTHVNLSNEDKLKEVSRCKASLTFNKLYINQSTQNNRIYKNLINHSFDFFDQGILPQFKVRTHEIASCKSLILCFKDHWNLIEDFYQEGEDFIYFESFEELEEILNDIDTNFEKYKKIIENAYEKHYNYSVEKIFNYMKTNDPSLITWKNKHV
jgi:spore maturation protein CgeB